MKIVFVGDANVGKTALFHKFVTNETLTHTEATLGVEFKKVRVTLAESREEIPLVVWDTAGQEKFQSVTTHHYRGTNAALVVYDITAPQSFRNLSRWIAEVREHAVEGVILAIVANKCDCPDRDYMIESGRSLAKQQGCLFFCASSTWDEGLAGESDTKGIGRVIEAACEEVILKQGVLQDRQVLSLSEEGSCNKELLNACVC